MAITAHTWTLGEYLRKAREETPRKGTDKKGLSQQEFADLIGISRSSVIDYEANKTVPRRIVLNAWALASGVPLEWLTQAMDMPPDQPDDASRWNRRTRRSTGPRPTHPRYARPQVLRAGAC